MHNYTPSSPSTSPASAPPRPIPSGSPRSPLMSHDPPVARRPVARVAGWRRNRSSPRRLVSADDLAESLHPDAAPSASH